MVVHLHSTLRHWMVVPAAFLLLMSTPIFVYIAVALWIGDLGRLFLGCFILAGYCLVAAVLVKLGIAIDEQMLRHERLKPDAHGYYERPLKKQPEPALQFELTMMEEPGVEGYTAAHGIPHDGVLSHEQGYTAR